MEEPLKQQEFQEIAILLLHHLQCIPEAPEVHLVLVMEEVVVEEALVLKEMAQMEAMELIQEDLVKMVLLLLLIQEQEEAEEELLIPETVVLEELEAVDIFI
jgi:hypothetical protein